MGKIACHWLVRCALVASLGAVTALGACGGDGDDYKVPSGGQDGGVHDGHLDAPGDDAPGGLDASSTEADLGIALTAAPSPVAASSTLTYSIVVTNAGGLTASGVTVVHTLPSGDVAFGAASGIGWTCSASGQIVTCTRASLIVGAAPTIDVTITTPPVGVTLTSTATVTSHTGDNNTANNSASVSTVVLTPADLQLTMSDSPDPVPAGGDVTYTLTVTNAGPGAATNIVVTDPVPTNSTFVMNSGSGWSCVVAPVSGGPDAVTCQTASLAASVSSQLALQFQVPSVGGALSNTATVSAMTPDPVPGNNSATSGTTVNAASDLSITVSGAPNPVVVNNTLTYTIDVSNAGPDSATGITVTDQLPSGNVVFGDASGAGWTCSPSGQTVTCSRASLLLGAAPSITLHVTTSDPSPLTNKVTVASTSSDPNPANNDAQTTTNVNPAADLAIVVVDTPDPVNTGGTLTYSLNVTNAGPSTAQALTVTDTLPTGTTFQSATGTNWTCSISGTTVSCTLAALTSGASAPAIAIVVTVPSNASTLTNTATVASATNDPQPGNNSGTATTTVNAPADLAVTLSSTPNPVGDSSTLTYTIGVSNNGPNDANNVVMDNRLPDGNVTYVSGTGIGWTCPTPGPTIGQIIECTRNNLIPGVAPSITITVKTPSSFSALTDTATVTSSTADLDSSNNSATVTNASTTVEADLSVTMTDSPDPIKPTTCDPSTGAGCITYATVVHNAGPDAAAGVKVVLTVPTDGALGAISGTGWSCGGVVGSTITCTLPAPATIASGTSAATINLRWAPPTNSGGEIIDCAATVSAVTTDPDTSNNAIDNQTTINP